MIKFFVFSQFFMQIELNHIHIWSKTLNISQTEALHYWRILNKEERQRASKFVASHHRNRFIATRANLRLLIGKYLYQSPDAIELQYATYQKPFLPNSELHFNLSHSSDLAVFAFCLVADIGIDIEEIKSNYNEEIAKRYFSPIENQTLFKLPKAEQIDAFYRLWSRKEAFLKATGKGLTQSLSDFTVSHENCTETIQYDNMTWSLYPINTYPKYAGAVVTTLPMQHISYFDL